jgi:hypothetical protein
MSVHADWLHSPPNLLFTGYSNLFSELQQLEREGGHSPTSIAVVKNEWRSTLLPVYALMSSITTLPLTFLR